MGDCTGAPRSRFCEVGDLEGVCCSGSAWSPVRGGWGVHAAAGSSWTRAWGNRDMSVGLQGSLPTGWLSPCPGLRAGLELPPVPGSLGSEGFGCLECVYFRTCRSIFNFCFCPQWNQLRQTPASYSGRISPRRAHRQREEGVATWVGPASGAGPVKWWEGPASRWLPLPTPPLLPCRLWRISRRRSSRRWHSPHRPRRSRRLPSSPRHLCPSPQRRAASSRPLLPCHHRPRHSPRHSLHSPRRRPHPQSPQ